MSNERSKLGLVAPRYNLKRIRRFDDDEVGSGDEVGYFNDRDYRQETRIQHFFGCGKQRSSESLSRWPVEYEIKRSSGKEEEVGDSGEESSKKEV